MATILEDDEHVEAVHRTSKSYLYNADLWIFAIHNRGDVEKSYNQWLSVHAILEEHYNASRASQGELRKYGSKQRLQWCGRLPAVLATPTSTCIDLREYPCTILHRPCPGTLFATPYETTC